jgi:uncharacterized protein
MSDNIERRFVTAEEDPDCELQIEKRANGREVIRGLAIPYNRMSLDLGGFRERILPGSFDKILNRERGRREILSFYNHNDDFLLGRESAGTLEIASDERGISYIVEPPDTSAGRDVLALVRSRNLQGSNGKAIREIVEASGLYEMGPVNVPAYGRSTSAVVSRRSYEAWLAEQQEQPAEVAARSLMASVAAAVSSALRIRLRG